MAERRLVAGVDSSTQATKVVVCDAATGQVVRQGRAPHPDGTEVDPEHWWRAWQLASADGVLDGVQAIAVGGQQHGLIALDEQHTVVRDALLWNDTRSADAAHDLVEERGGRQVWSRETGVVPVASITVAKLRWLATHEPESMRRTRTVLLPHDWLTGRLVGAGAGPAEWTTDRGDASGTGYWSTRSGSYQPDVLELACGRTPQLPRVLGPSEPAGQTPDGLLVGAGTGDNMAAALGLDVQPGDVVVSLGTSGTIYARSDVCPDDPSGAVSGFADATGQFLPLMCTLNAARVLSASAAMLGVDLQELDRLARSAPLGADGLTLLPYLDGERTPDLPHATGTLHGLTRTNATPANLARAAVEGMLLNLVGGIDLLRAQGVSPTRVILIGGASVSVAVQQVAAQLAGLEVVVPPPGEYVGIGAARQAAWALDGGTAPPTWPIDVHPVAEPAAGSAEQAREVVGRYQRLLETVHG